MSSHQMAAVQVLQGIYAANNIAASSIAKGDNLEAFRTIQTATRQGTSLAPWVAEHESKASAHTKPIAVIIKPIYAVEVWSTEGDGFVFSCPFLMTSFPPSDMMGIGLDTVKSMSSVAIFNMALACHLQVHVSDDCRKMEVLLQRARALYAQAAHLLDGCLVFPNESVLQLYLAICNNLIEVSLAMANLEEASHWKNRLDAALQNIPDYCGGNYATSLLAYFKGIRLIYAGTFMAAKAA